MCKTYQCGAPLYNRGRHCSSSCPTVSRIQQQRLSTLYTFTHCNINDCSSDIDQDSDGIEEQGRDIPLRYSWNPPQDWQDCQDGHDIGPQVCPSTDMLYPDQATSYYPLQPASELTSATRCTRSASRLCAQQMIQSLRASSLSTRLSD